MTINKSSAVIMAAMWVLCGLIIGISMSTDTSTVHAQGTGFTGCTVAGGASTPCSQYLVQVNTGRGLGRMVIYKITSGPLDVSTMAFMASGNPSTSATDYEAPPRSTVPFTITAGE